MSWFWEEIFHSKRKYFLIESRGKLEKSQGKVGEFRVYYLADTLFILPAVCTIWWFRFTFISQWGVIIQGMPYPLLKRVPRCLHISPRQRQVCKGKGIFHFRCRYAYRYMPDVWEGKKLVVSCINVSLFMEWMITSTFTDGL